MKKIFLTLALILISTVGKSQNTMEIYVDTTYVFDYPDTLPFFYAWNNGYAKPLNQARTYKSKGHPWVIDRVAREVTFHGEPPRPFIGIEKENSKIEFIGYKGVRYKIFLMTCVETERDMVFLLEEPKDGRIVGAFGYPTKVEIK